MRANAANAKRPASVSAGLSLPRTADNLTGQSEIGHSSKNVLSIASRDAEPTESISWSWRGADFVRVAEGNYLATCAGTKGPEWVPAYRRWSFRVLFQLMDEDIEVTMFINFGSTPDPKNGGRPRPPKSIASKYYKAWTIVNGEAPLRGQAMLPRVFTEPGLLYTLQIEDAKIDPATKADKPPSLVYSRVKEILSVRRP